MKKTNLCNLYLYALEVEVLIASEVTFSLFNGMIQVVHHSIVLNVFVHLYIHTMRYFFLCIANIKHATQQCNRLNEFQQCKAAYVRRTRLHSPNAVAFSGVLCMIKIFAMHISARSFSRINHTQ